MQISKFRGDITSYKPRVLPSPTSVTKPSALELLGTGVRSDGRKPLAMRKMSFEFDVVSSAKASVFAQCGNEKLIVSIFGPKQLRESQYSNTGRFLCQCKFAAFAHGSRRKDSSKEARRVRLECRLTEQRIEEALSNAVLLQRYPKSVIEAHVLFLECDSSRSLAAAINAVSIALVDAGIEMRDTVTCCTSLQLLPLSLCKSQSDLHLDDCCKSSALKSVKTSSTVLTEAMEVDSEDTEETAEGGLCILDASLAEELELHEFIQCQLTVACLNSSQQISVFDMDGSLKPHILKTQLQTCLTGCHQIREMFRAVLFERCKKKSACSS